MNYIPIISKILIQIINDNIPFNIAIRNNSKDKNEDPHIKRLVSSNVGCVLRHYYVFSQLISNEFENLSLEATVIIMALLADVLFVRKIGEKEIIDYIQNNIQEIDIVKLNEFINEYKGGTPLIPEAVKNTSVEFLSLRYNAPAWLVKMWRKHYGPHLCQKILKANSKPADVFCRLCQGITKDEVLQDTNFIEVPMEDELVCYIGKTPLRDHPLFIEKKIFPTSRVVKGIFDKLELDPLKGVAVYSGYANNYFLEFNARFGNNFGYEIVFGSSQAYFEAKRIVNFYGLQKVRLYEEPNASIELCLSSKYHTFICSPSNSHFSLLRDTPDYFLRFKQDSFDALIANELKILNQADVCVEDDGELVYIIPTISYKESHNVVEQFLLSYPNYSLIEEKQYLPCDAFNSILYFAILKKSLKND